jgi:DivIVA domain-containing protein
LSFSFPTVNPNHKGYRPEQVDEFIGQLKQQYLSPQNSYLRSHELRSKEFDLVNGGYQVNLVDEAIDRLEDKFADRELAAKSVAEKSSRAREIKELLSGRSARPAKKRFDRTGLLLRGYNVAQVDAFIDQVAKHLDSQSPLDLGSVRHIVFRPTRNGYDESRVDLFIDRVIELIQIERNS